MRLVTLILWLLTFVGVSSCMTYQEVKSLVTPNRATIGISTDGTTVESNGNSLCVGQTPDISTDNKCENGGFKRFDGKLYFDPSLEFSSNYFGQSSFGWSYFLRYQKIKTSLINYPLDSEKTHLYLKKIGLNPYLYYNLGQRFPDGKGLSFRIGLGLSLGYFFKFNLIRDFNDEHFSNDHRFKIGTSSFIEFNWRWFALRVSHSEYNFKGSKFSHTPSDKLNIETTRISFFYVYYF